MSQIITFLSVFVGNKIIIYLLVGQWWVTILYVYNAGYTYTCATSLQMFVTILTDYLWQNL